VVADHAYDPDEWRADRRGRTGATRGRPLVRARYGWYGMRLGPRDRMGAAEPSRARVADQRRVEVRPFADQRSGSALSGAGDGQDTGEIGAWQARGFRRWRRESTPGDLVGRRLGRAVAGLRRCCCVSGSTAAHVALIT